MAGDSIRDHRERLEEELVARYRAERPQRRWTMNLIPSGPVGRWATVGLGLALTVAACATPTTTEKEMGQQMVFHFDDAAAAKHLLEAMPGMTQLLRAQPGVDEVSVNVKEEATGSTELDLVLWGSGMDERAIGRKLQEHYPALAEAQLESHELTTRIRESLAAKLSRQVLHIEIDGDQSEDEMRAQILADLAAQGFEGDAVVDVQRDGDQTTIGVSLSSDGVETEDVIELIGDVDGTQIELPHGEDAENAKTTVREVEAVRKGN